MDAYHIDGEPLLLATVQHGDGRTEEVCLMSDGTQATNPVRRLGGGNRAQRRAAKKSK